jgi:hypothetical protein
MALDLRQEDKARKYIVVGLYMEGYSLQHISELTQYPMEEVCNYNKSVLREWRQMVMESKYKEPE